MVKSDNVQMRSGGGTLLADGTVKWDVRKIGNAEELNGQAIEDFKSELLAAVPEQKVYSTVRLIYGTVNVSGSVDINAPNPSGTIPLPSGYTRAQCKYVVFGKYAGYPNQSTGQVYSYSIPNEYWKYGQPFDYLCIAVK